MTMLSAKKHVYSLIGIKRSLPLVCPVANQLKVPGKAACTYTRGRRGGRDTLAAVLYQRVVSKHGSLTGDNSGCVRFCQPKIQGVFKVFSRTISKFSRSHNHAKYIVVCRIVCNRQENISMTNHSQLLFARGATSVRAVKEKLEKTTRERGKINRHGAAG